MNALEAVVEEMEKAVPEDASDASQVVLSQAVAAPEQAALLDAERLAELPDFVTLDQAAAISHKSKRTLERDKTKGKLPAPAVEGGAGRADLYDWKVMRPWLVERFGVPLPERFPRGRYP